MLHRSEIALTVHAVTVISNAQPMTANAMQATYATVTPKPANLTKLR